MAKLLYKFINAETIEEGSRKISSAPENWVIDGRLHWPPPKEVNWRRKKQTPPEEGWTEYDCKILGESFSTIKEALAKEKTYERFSNSESEKEYMRQQEENRKHPVVFDLIDANQIFDKIQTTREIMHRNLFFIINHSTEGTIDLPCVIMDPILPDELLDDQFLSEETNLSAIGEAMNCNIVSTKSDLQPNQTVKLSLSDLQSNQNVQSNQYPAKPIQYPSQMNQHPVQPSPYNLPPSDYNLLKIGENDTLNVTIHRPRRINSTV